MTCIVHCPFVKLRNITVCGLESLQCVCVGGGGGACVCVCARARATCFCFCYFFQKRLNQYFVPFKTCSLDLIEKFVTCWNSACLSRFAKRKFSDLEVIRTKSKTLITRVKQKQTKN